MEVSTNVYSNLEKVRERLLIIDRLATLLEKRVFPVPD